MDIAAFKNRMEELERGMKDLRIDFELDQNIGWKLEELRDKMDIVTKDGEFFRKMSMEALGKRDQLGSARINMIIKADIFLNKENYEKLKENPEFIRITKELERCQHEIDVGSRYCIQTDQEKHKLMQQIRKLECREMQYNY